MRPPAAALAFLALAAAFGIAGAGAEPSRVAEAITPKNVLRLEVARALDVPAEAGRVLAFAPSGFLLAAAGRDGQVRLWDASTGKAATALPVGGGVTSVAFGPEARLLAT